MAKIALTKLGLKPNIEIKTIEWNGQNVEVKQYLPIEAKLDLISDIANKSLDDNSYYNPARIKIFIRLEIILAYANINTTDKQREDIFKLYDMFAGELGDKIIEAIPVSEYNFIKSTTWDIIEGIYKYKNSAMGIMESIANDYSSLDFDATEIQKKIGDPNNMELLKQVLSKLG
jgi:hypothetical protein